MLNLIRYRSWRSISLLKCKYWTTRTCDAASAPQIISPPRASSPSFARCPCDWMKAGIRSNLTFPTSHVVPMAQITSRPCGCKSTPIAVFEGPNPYPPSRPYAIVACLNLCEQVRCEIFSPSWNIFRLRSNNRCAPDNIPNHVFYCVFVIAMYDDLACLFCRASLPASV